jgi:hypothetical protein
MNPNGEDNNESSDHLLSLREEHTRLLAIKAIQDTQLEELKAIRAMQDTQLKELEAERSQKENDVAIRKAKPEEKKD